MVVLRLLMSLVWASDLCKAAKEARVKAVEER